MNILIVDDNQVCRALYRKELERGGYNILESVDGVDALRVIREHEVDLVVLDIQMPNMDGYTVCERLRSQEFSNRFHHNPDGILPVVFVTADHSRQGRIRGFNNGATDFITKGFRPGTLLSVVDAVLKPTDPLHGLDVLVVGSGPDMKKISAYLSREKVRVHSAKSGEQGFEWLLGHNGGIGALITDLELPGMSGDKLCSKVRGDLGIKNIPHIVLAGKKDVKVLENLYTKGVTDYLLHPFEPEELGARLKIALETIHVLERDIQQRSRRLDRPASQVEPDSREISNMANSVIHNIGNVLNSVYVSCYQISNHIDKSKLQQLLLAHKLIVEHREDPAAFFSEDPRGKKLPRYLTECGKVIEKEHMKIAGEIRSITNKVNLIKDMIEIQQVYAKGGDTSEKVVLASVIEDALEIQSDFLKECGVTVENLLDKKHTVASRRSVLVHVLVNLIKNAAQAMRESEPRILILKTKVGSKNITLEVSDTGTGIIDEIAEKIFLHGFTTKKDGHGFGLSYCLKAIREMNGDLRARSEGPGMGATFSLTFPRLG